MEPTEKQNLNHLRGAAKVARIPIKIVPSTTLVRKPAWIRAKSTASPEVARFVTPDEFDRLAELGKHMGFSNVASGPMVRSSYHADLQAAGRATG